MKNKLKTNKSASKRFIINSSGKVKFKRAKMRHRQRSKEKDTKRVLRKAGFLNLSNRKMVQNMLPYN